MMIFVIVVHVLACLTLIAVILLQAGRGHGLAGGSFGAEMNTVFGTKTAKFMTKMTSVCAILFLVTCLTIDIMIARSGRSLLEDDIAQGLTQAQIDEMMAKIEDLQEEQEGVAEDIDTVSAEVDAVVDEAQVVIDEEVVDIAAALQDKMEEAVADVDETVIEDTDVVEEEIEA